MKTLSLTLFIASSIAMTATPAFAKSSKAPKSGTVIQFAYKASELKSTQGREALMQRMKLKAYNSCIGKYSKAYATPTKCQKDLEDQFVKAIGSSVLLAEYEGQKEIKVALK